MSKLIVAAVAAIMFSSTLCAEEPSKNELTFDANLRFGYIKNKPDGAADETSQSAGGQIGFTTKEILTGIKADVAFYAIEALSSQNSNDDFNIAPGNSLTSYGFVGEAALKGEYGDHHFTVGRQQLDTPHADGDDIRMVPNLFDAYSYGYKESFELVHINSMAGWENGVDQTQFIDVHQVLDITDATGQAISDGITMVHLGHKSENELFTFDLYGYMIHKAINTLYAEITYTAELSPVSNFILSAQYDVNQGSDTFQMGGTTYTEYDAKVWGVSAALELKGMNLTATLAMNGCSGTDAPIGSLGGGAYYTSMEDSTIDAVGTSDATASIAILEYDASAIADGMALSYFYGMFAADDKTVADHVEQNFALEYERKDLYTFTVAYTTVSNASTVTGAQDFTLLRAFLDFPFEK